MMEGVLITIFVTASFLMSQISKVPLLIKMLCVIITIRELSVLLMLQIPQMPAITRMVQVPHRPHHRGGEERSE